MGKSFWEHYSHPADVGIRGFGPTKEEAFGQAALAMTAVITDLRKVQPKEMVEIICSEQDDELLFAAWLNALLYEMATRKMLFRKFLINIENHRLQAEAWGEKINLKKHNPVVEVKAATYADLKVRQEKDGNWLAQCIVDV
jgi:SHS2 domain-containing protein